MRSIEFNSVFKSVKSTFGDDSDPGVAIKDNKENDSCANFFNPDNPNAKRNLCKAFSHLAKMCPKTCNL